MRSGLPRAALPVRRGKTKTDFARRAQPKRRSRLLKQWRSSSGTVHPAADFGFVNEQLTEQRDDHVAGMAEQALSKVACGAATESLRSEVALRLPERRLRE